MGKGSTGSTGPAEAEAGPAERVSPARRLVARAGVLVSTDSFAATLLLAATLLALLWANSPWSGSYEAFWHSEFALRWGDTELAMDLRHWVNDGLMAVFFFVVGLEVRRELVLGDLTDRRRARVPLAAAVAGLALPALIFLLFNPSGDASRAWGVVISTDTAFLLGVLALVIPRGAVQLRPFLLALAVADDIGALLIIALFYTEQLALVPLIPAVCGLLAVVVLARFDQWRGPAYFVVSLVVWLGVEASGVHPTIAGVAIALLMPVHPPRRQDVEDAALLARRFRQSPSAEYARSARQSVDRAVSINERAHRLWQPWSALVIVPVFAVANAGVRLDGETLSAALRSPLTWGVVAGLVVGKTVGITGAAAWAVRMGMGTLPGGLRLPRLAGGAALSGIGFTISLFIIDLALKDPALQDQARVGVLLASVLAVLTGWLITRGYERLRPEEASKPPDRLVEPVDPDRDHVLGPDDAPLTLVEYADFECPFCGRATGSVDEVRRHFGERLRYVYRHYPLGDVHPHAALAAEASEAAAAQGGFWPMHDRLFARSHALTFDDLVAHADALGLDTDRFARELRLRLHERRVREDVRTGQVSGVRGTPTFFIGDELHQGPFDAVTLIERLTAADPGDGASRARTGST
ncbi:Na+/H+ antiporter NhaA [Streptomyces daliensis]|uniref:Na(+)/H(+) antiporter NhaA n=1 Tax=Streptomyces daliensis TaxID=299421 RepID=A0A8T4J6A2_9ACTN|nr:Na+/H+ antiporter NhaA [Streptomyces daliensis]